MLLWTVGGLFMACLFFYAIHLQNQEEKRKEKDK